jgi:hypothetical protein
MFGRNQQQDSGVSTLKVAEAQPALSLSVERSATSQQEASLGTPSQITFASLATDSGVKGITPVGTADAVVVVRGSSVQLLRPRI